MPVSIKRSPFDNTRPKQSHPINGDKLRTPQARVLAALYPEYPEDPPSEWPLVSRGQLNIRAGYTVTSGTVTRALNGVRDGSKSCTPHLGLIARGLVTEEVLDIDGVSETNYRITLTGIRAYQTYKLKHGTPPEVKDPSTYINDRYKKKSEEN